MESHTVIQTVYKICKWNETLPEVLLYVSILSDFISAPRDQETRPILGSNNQLADALLFSKAETHTLYTDARFLRARLQWKMHRK